MTWHYLALRVRRQFTANLPTSTHKMNALMIYQPQDVVFHWWNDENEIWKCQLNAFSYEKCVLPLNEIEACLLRKKCIDLNDDFVDQSHECFSDNTVQWARKNVGSCRKPLNTNQWGIERIHEPLKFEYFKFNYSIGRIISIWQLSASAVKWALGLCDRRGYGRERDVQSVQTEMWTTFRTVSINMHMHHEAAMVESRMVACATQRYTGNSRRALLTRSWSALRRASRISMRGWMMGY